jgi:hypothetical protein
VAGPARRVGASVRVTALGQRLAEGVRVSPETTERLLRTGKIQAGGGIASVPTLLMRELGTRPIHRAPIDISNLQPIQITGYFISILDNVSSIFGHMPVMNTSPLPPCGGGQGGGRARSARLSALSKLRQHPYPSSPALAGTCGPRCRGRRGEAME